MSSSRTPRRGAVAVITVALGLLAGLLAAIRPARADYPDISTFIPAAPSTYIPAERDASDIRYLIIHDTDVSYAGTVGLFTTPGHCCSAHYLVSGAVGSADPGVTQFVKDTNIVHQSGNLWMNEHSIGVEHVGFAAFPNGYYTPKLYRRSAKLIGWLAAEYRIPLDRSHILTHSDVPGGPLEAGQAITPDNVHNQHWDPGPYWDWNYYWPLVESAYDKALKGTTVQPELPKKFRATNSTLRQLAPGHQYDGKQDVGNWSNTLHTSFAPVYANDGGRPDLNTLVLGASDPRTFVPPETSAGTPTANVRDFVCDNYPAVIFEPDAGPNGTSSNYPITASDLRAKADWGSTFVSDRTKRTRGVTYDRIWFNGTRGWIPRNLTVAGSGAVVTFKKNGSTDVYSSPQESPDFATCSDEGLGYSRAGQSYVSQYQFTLAGQKWFALDYNHRLVYVPKDQVKVSTAGQ